MRTKRKSIDAMNILTTQLDPYVERLMAYDKFYIYDMKDENNILWNSAMEVLVGLTDERIYGVVNVEEEPMIATPDKGRKTLTSPLNDKRDEIPVHLRKDVREDIADSDVILIAPRNWEEYDSLLAQINRAGKKFIAIADESFLEPEDFDDFEVIERDKYDYVHYTYCWVTNL